MEEVKRIAHEYVAPFVVFFLMVLLLAPFTNEIVAQELRISQSLARQVTSLTGGAYLAIYLIGEFLRAAVFTKQYRDSIAIGSVFIGVLFGSLNVAIGLVLLTSIIDRAYAYWREHRAQAGAEQATNHP